MKTHPSAALDPYLDRAKDALAQDSQLAGGGRAPLEAPEKKKRRFGIF
jgi:hypothetical protein